MHVFLKQSVYHEMQKAEQIYFDYRCQLAGR